MLAQFIRLNLFVIYLTGMKCNAYFIGVKLIPLGSTKSKNMHPCTIKKYLLIIHNNVSFLKVEIFSFCRPLNGKRNNI